MNNIQEKLSADFIVLMQNLLGEEDYNKYIQSFNSNAVKGIRVNNQKISTEDFLKLYNQKVDKIPYFDSAFYVENDKVGLNVLHQIGAFYSQEPSSMVPVACVSHLNLKGKKVLDLCASPGGKSGQIYSLIGNEGLLVSNEVVTSRAKILFSNIERLGLTNTIVLNEKVEKIAKFFQGFFDVVIVDAPCSGEGMFRKDESAILQWSLEAVKSNSERQKNIIDSAVKCLKKDGILIYSTCTYNQFENDENVDYILQKSFSQLPISNNVIPFVRYGYKKDKIVRCFPFEIKGEGQFCSIFQNNNENEISNNCLKKINYSSNKIATEFLEKFFDFPFDYFLEEVNNNICLINKNFCNTNGLNVLSKGIIVGNITKNRLEPHHQLFSSLGKYCTIKLDLTNNEEDLKKYLKGEQLSYDLPNGFGCVMFNGISVGGFKSVNGELKNYYPKGLRIVIK